MTGGQKARTDFVDAIILGTLTVFFGMPIMGLVAFFAWDWVVQNPWIIAPILFTVFWILGGFERQKMNDEKDAWINGWSNDYMNNFD